MHGHASRIEGERLGKSHSFRSMGDMREKQCWDTSRRWVERHVFMILNPGIYWKQILESTNSKLSQHAICNNQNLLNTYLHARPISLQHLLGNGSIDNIQSKIHQPCRSRSYVGNNLTSLAIPVEVMFWPSVAGFVPISQINIMEC